MSSIQNFPWKPVDVIFLVLTIIGWGGNFLAIRYAVLEIPSWTALALRLILVGCILMPFLRNPLPQLKRYLILSALLVPGHFGMLFLASELTTNVASLSMYIQLGPAFAVLFAWYYLKEKPGTQKLIGLALAFIAMAILYYEPNLMGMNLAILAAIGAALTMGIYSVMLRTIDHSMRPIDIIGWTAIFGVPVIIAIAYIVEGFPVYLVTQVSNVALAAIVYSTFIASMLCHGAWAWLCRRHPVSEVSPYTLLVPVLAITLSVILLDEPLTGQMIVAAVILFSGIFLIAKSKRKRK